MPLEEHMRKIPETYIEFTKRYPEVATAYENLAGECHESGPLKQRDRALVKLGIAVGSWTEGAVRSQTRKCLDAGLNPDEIRQVFILSLTSIGFAKMMAALTWVEDLLKQE
jgi:alkylhydroperoxidase/carboxymuconolactone decarboxylase family protein YurZ